MVEFFILKMTKHRSATPVIFSSCDEEVALNEANNGSNKSAITNEGSGKKPREAKRPWPVPMETKAVRWGMRAPICK